MITRFGRVGDIKGSLCMTPLQKGNLTLPESVKI